MKQIVLLGPQRTRPTVAAALEDMDTSGPVAVISAGWQEREGELEPLSGHLEGIELTDLALYARAEKLFDSDSDLRRAWRQRQEWLKELQRLYRRRLRHTLRAVRELDDTNGIDSLIDRERGDALAALRELDEQHLHKIREIQSEQQQHCQPARHEALVGERQEIAEQLERCNTLLIAGGHVGVLLNRLRLFDIGQMIGHKSVVAWSAGAMALSERIVLFHDSPPQGAGDAEVFDTGLTAYKGVVVFPDADRRLALDDARRVALVAGRFEPADSITLDESSILVRDGHNWQTRGSTRVLSADGTVRIVSS